MSTPTPYGKSPATLAFWKGLVAARLHEAYRAFRDAVSRLSDADLGRPMPGDAEPLGELLAGMLEHDAYHAGQIMLLRKLQGSSPGPPLTPLSLPLTESPFLRPIATVTHGAPSFRPRPRMIHEYPTAAAAGFSAKRPAGA